MRHPSPYHLWFREVAEAYELGLVRLAAEGKSPAPIQGTSVFTGVKEDYDNGRDPEDVALAILEGRHRLINPVQQAAA